MAFSCHNRINSRIASLSMSIAESLKHQRAPRKPASPYCDLPPTDPPGVGLTKVTSALFMLFPFVHTPGPPAPRPARGGPSPSSRSTDPAVGRSRASGPTVGVQLRQVELIPSLLLHVRVLRLGELLLELLPGDLLLLRVQLLITLMRPPEHVAKDPRFQLLRLPFLAELFAAFGIRIPAVSDSPPCPRETLHRVLSPFHAPSQHPPQTGQIEQTAPGFIPGR